MNLSILEISGDNKNIWNVDPGAITDSKAQVEKTELVTKIIFVVNVV